MDNMPNDRTVVDTPFEVWDRTMAVNLRGYFAAAKYAVPHMIAQGGGSVINMSSDSGLRSDTAHISYGVSKAVIVMLTYAIDRKRVVEGKSVSVRVDVGGRRIIKKKNKNDRIRAHYHKYNMIQCKERYQ